MKIKTTLLSLAAALSANAQTLIDWNLFVLENLNASGGRTMGSAAILGDTNATSFEVNQQNNDARGLDNVSAYFGGDVTFSSHVRVMNGDSLFGTSVNTAVDTQQGSETLSGELYPNASQNFIQLSSLIDSYDGVSVNTSNPNIINITLTERNKVYVFDLDSSQLSGLKTLNIHGPGKDNSYIIFNVHGETVNWSWQNNFDSSRTLWNFTNATTLNVGLRQLNGSVLAPFATLNQTQNITGNVVVKNLNISGGAAILSADFQGPIPSVPEPGTTFMMLLSSLVLMAIRRK